MKISRGKLLGILLTASIITAVFPMQGTAAEEDLSVMPFSYDINQPVIESFELEENGRTLSINDTLHFKISAYDADRDIRSITVQIKKMDADYFARSVIFQKSEDAENLYTGTYDCQDLAGYEGDFYVSQILLEDEADNYVEWPVMEDGKYLYTFTYQNTRSVSVSDYKMQINSSHPDGKLRPGDTVTYTAHLEYEGIRMRFAELNLRTTQDSGVSRSDTIYMDYDEETKTLTGTYTIKEDTYPSDWIIYHLRIIAPTSSNSFYPNWTEPLENITFTVVNDAFDKEKPVIESISIDKNGQTVKAEENVTLKIKVNETNPQSSIKVKFTPQASGARPVYYYPWLNEATMEYTQTIPITLSTRPGRWDLTEVSVSDKYGNTAGLSDFREDWDTARPWYYTVDPEGYLDDQKAPVIESITIDKNGQWVYPGDTVTLTVKVDEENPSYSSYAYFYPQASNVSGYRLVNLYYNANSREYTGTISITNDTYPCEWMLTDIAIFDIRQNRASLDDFKPDWKKTCPWYYRVETDNTYREDVNDAAFSVYGLVRQEYGGYTYGPVVEDKTVKVGRRDSLQGLGICPPLPAEGVNVKFTEENSGIEVNADTEIFFGNTPNPSYQFRAAYDKSCVNVVLSYISRDKGATTAIVPQFVDKDATYGEMLASFVPPEDADLELLAGYQLDAPLSETAQTEDLGYAGVTARYNDRLVAWNVKYLDENGNEVSKIITKGYEANTTIHDALAALEVPAAPAGLEFERWALPGINGNEILSHEMTNLNVTAVYKGRTTAEVSYTYRGENGKLVSGSLLLALEGEQLSYQAAFEEVKTALKELSHLKGLVLTDWTPITTSTDIASYKKMNIKARYANCAVILKYPKDVYEYVVVEKGSLFTLPVTNNTYTDILWEGYSRGQAVAITGDMEFIVADAKRKDGTTETPSGGKPPADEIDKIVADIQQSGNGETIHIDMRKSTVVPKEVLEAIKGKDVSIVLDMGGYSWSISGKDVSAAVLKDIDLKVIVDTDGIPPAIVDSVAEGKPSTQITLAHNGEFGFRAELTVNLGAEHSGSTGNLYYYDSSGKLVYIDAGMVGANGNISLSFSHASEYVVIFEKTSLESGNKMNSGTKTESAASPGSDVKKEKGAGIRKSPKTGE